MMFKGFMYHCHSWTRRICTKTAGGKHFKRGHRVGWATLNSIAQDCSRFIAQIKGLRTTTFSIPERLLSMWCTQCNEMGKFCHVDRPDLRMSKYNTNAIFYRVSHSTL